MSRGPTRLLHDKGVRLAVGLMVIVIMAAVLKVVGDENARMRENRTPHLSVRVWCDGRTAAGASGTLRPDITMAPERVGQPYSTAVTTKNGVLELALPYPTPPGFKAELLVAARGCLSERRMVGASPREFSVELKSVEGRAPPVDVTDPPVAPRFPPSADEEHVRRLRILGTGAADGFVLFDGPAPTCAQCHVSTGAEHQERHGGSISAAVRTLAAKAPAADALECARCHAPTAALAASDVRAPLPEGSAFSCSACHLHRPDPNARSGDGLGLTGDFVHVPRDRRAQARGTRPDTASPTMAVMHAPDLKGSALCVSCHAQARRVEGRLLVVDPTADEHEAWRTADPSRSNTSCQGCHFPATDDPFLVDGYARWLWGVERRGAPRRSHARLRSYAEEVERAVRLEARWEGNVLVVVAENVGASHALPGVAPLEGWAVQVSGTPVDGPRLSDASPGVLLARELGAPGLDGCALPWEATNVTHDGRLRPGAAQQWRWRYETPTDVEVQLLKLTRCAERARTLPLPPESMVLKRIKVPSPT